MVRAENSSVDRVSSRVSLTAVVGKQTYRPDSSQLLAVHVALRTRHTSTPMVPTCESIIHDTDEPRCLATLVHMKGAAWTKVIRGCRVLTHGLASQLMMLPRVALFSYHLCKAYCFRSDLVSLRRLSVLALTEGLGDPKVQRIPSRSPCDRRCEQSRSDSREEWLY